MVVSLVSLPHYSETPCAPVASLNTAALNTINRCRGFRYTSPG